jgi:hypothetical protein
MHTIVKVTHPLTSFYVNFDALTSGQFTYTEPNDFTFGISDGNQRHLLRYVAGKERRCTWTYTSLDHKLFGWEHKTNTQSR